MIRPVELLVMAATGCNAFRIVGAAGAGQHVARVGEREHTVDVDAVAVSIGRTGGHAAFERGASWLNTVAVTLADTPSMFSPDPLSAEMRPPELLVTVMVEGPALVRRSRWPCRPVIVPELVI